MIKDREEELDEIIRRAKGEVCKEFEKICSTDRSFFRAKKDMHNIFDQLFDDIKKVL